MTQASSVMKNQCKARDFSRTRAALAEFDADEPQRLLARECGNVEVCVDMDLRAEQAVQTAFYEDTKDINSLDDCLGTDIWSIRKVVR